MAPRASRYFAGQNYAKLRKECEQKKQPFVDVTFPPTNASLFVDEGRTSDIEWRRPAEIVDNPRLFVEGASANDVTQGILGNCWFVSACSALTHNQNLLNKVIPNAEKQEWGAAPYVGIFRFCFWRFGQWIDVVIDDLLPTRDGKLIFARSKTHNEFWSALLEKAFAKLYGCYENLVGGRLSDALQDVSGGVAETINVAKYTAVDSAAAVERLYGHVKASFDNGALIVAAIAAKTKDEIEMPLECGLVKGHAYAVTAVNDVELANNAGIVSRIIGTVESAQLIRLQNPWGEKEWNGPWSDGSKEWEQVTDAMKKELHITVDEDGEFWMPWHSFVSYFTDVSLCQLFNTKLFTLSKKFREEVLYGEWSSNGARSGAPQDRAGGCLNFTATCCSNPQYIIDVHVPENQFMVNLTQKEINEGLKRREPHVSIGMVLMKVEKNRRYRVHQPMECIATSEYANSRSVFLTVRDIPVGRYILMPTTYAPREQTTFLLRVYSDFDCKLRALTKHAPREGFFSCRMVGSVTRIKIISANINNRQHEKDVYCIIFSRGEQAHTGMSKAPRPEWNDQFLFHRRSRRQAYRIEMWESHIGPDKMVGVSELFALIDNDSKTLELAVNQKGSKGERVGTLKVQLSAYDDPLYL